MFEELLTNHSVAFGLVIVTTIFAFAMQLNVSGTFNRYSKMNSRRNQPAHKIARQILDNNGLYEISVVRTPGNLTDHYDPINKIIALSDSVYDSASIAAIGVAAHECGHAVQHNTDYYPIKVRHLIFPAVNFASRFWMWAFILGIFFSIPFLTQIGIVFFSLVAVFQFVTLPVEFDASNRAMATMKSDNILDDDELKYAKKTLSAAAMTYVAALLVSIAQLIRLISQSNRRS